MSTPLSSATSREQLPQEGWPLVAPYVAPLIAGSAAIVPVFGDMIDKSALQKGQEIVKRTTLKRLGEGIQAAPTVGALIGIQMMVQNVVEKTLIGESKTPSLSSALISAAAVGLGSSPVVAIFNGRTQGWGMRESLSKFSPAQASAIGIQETACLGGLAAADKVAAVMKERFGDNRAVDYTAAFLSGAAGGLAGHPANTVLTRSQSGMALDSFSQLMWGAGRRARALGYFSVLYKLVKDTLNSTAQTS